MSYLIKITDGQKTSFSTSPTPIVVGEKIVSVTEPSKNHVAWSENGLFEFVKVGGDIARADVNNVMDVDGNRPGRFECSQETWEIYANKIPALKTI